MGRVEREIIALLVLYRDLGDCGLQPHFDGRGSLLRTILLENAAKRPDEYEARKIALYRHCVIVEVQRIRREVGRSAAVTSRALRSLERRGFVHLMASDLEPIRGHWYSSTAHHAKHAGLTGAGLDAATKCKLSTNEKVSAYPGAINASGDALADGPATQASEYSHAPDAP